MALRPGGDNYPGRKPWRIRASAVRSVTAAMTGVRPARLRGADLLDGVRAPGSREAYGRRLPAR